MRALLAVLAVAATPGIHHTPAGTAAAHRALVHRADLGAGWVAGPTPKTVGALTCGSSTPPKGVVETGSAISPTYQASAVGPFLSQSVHVYASGGAASKVFARVGGKAALTCLAQSFLGADPNKQVAFSVGKQQTLAAPKVHGSASAYRVVGRALVSAQKVTVYVDIVLVQRGNAITALSYASFSVPLPASLEARVARAAANRL